VAEKVNRTLPARNKSYTTIQLLTHYTIMCATMYNVTDGRTNEIMILRANRTACSTIG